MPPLHQPFRPACPASPPPGDPSATPIAPQPALDALFRQIAQDLRADAVSLGIDTGNGYRFAQYREDDALPDNLASIVLAPPQGYRVHARPLSIGSPRRRHAPRSQITLLRAPGQPDFNRSAQRYLGVLQPHLVHVIELAHELDAARSRESCARTLLESAECGCLIVSTDGTVIQHNTRARTLLESVGGELARTLTLPGFDLQRRYAVSLARLKHETAPFPLMLDIPATPPLRLHLQTADAMRGLLAVTIEVAQPTQVMLSQAFQARYGLTHAEFRLCQALAAGLTLKQCACQWDRSYETLRAQLKSVFSKTGCHRQLALTLLLRDHALR
ncbi:MAG: hypothetical protein ACLGG6_07775 [Gammaproteobacteria bacterium]